MPRWVTLTFVMIIMLFTTAFALAQGANATVIDMANTLNVRTAPTGSAAIIAELPGSSPVVVIGRTPTNRWYQIQTPDGAISGWAASDFINLNVPRADIPIITDGGTVSSSTSTGSTSETTTTTPATSDAPVGNVVGTGTVNVSALNLRNSATTRAAIIRELPLNTDVNIVGRNSTSTWLQVQLGDGTVGWVSARYIDLNTRMSSVPVVNSSTVITTTTTNSGSPSSASEVTFTANVPAGDAPYFTLGAATANIFATGQELGNRANVFSKIGDSITVDEDVFGPFGFGVYNLGGFGYLEPTIGFFSAQARNNNSFNNTSLAAGNGFTTSTVLSSELANPALCMPGESLLACEYRLTRPAVALIMLGSNDTTVVNIEDFAANINTIAEYSVANGVIPVFTTIPPRPNFPGRAESYNQIIISVAASRGLPLIDYYSAMVTLPDSGLREDGLHPSSPPLGFEDAADFRGDNLQYGYVMRNLTILQALHVLRTSVLQ